MPRKIAASSPDAEIIALKCLSFLAEDEGRLERFMALSGLDPASLAAQAAEPAFLAGIMDYVFSEEKLLLAFSEQAGLRPEAIIALRRHLPGDAAC